MKNCQSCKIKSVAVMDLRDSEVNPYRLCRECHQRLINNTLSPFEYMNLTAVHGLTNLLSDLFYDKNGQRRIYCNSVKEHGL